MIVEKVERPVFTSMDSAQRRFRIDESGLVNILTILRKNMYSNPTRIIVQEYANNARDAHVEAGRRDRPIQITCPTSISPYLKIRDYGRGISPEQIDSIFVAYGASTKRHTNEYVGGFGLGAKSAFSYCDAFEVTTICDGIKYTYAPHIDSSDVGEMPLIAQEPTDEESGTLISIHIKDDDLYRVNNAISLVTEYWDVRPEIIGNVNYSNRKVYFSEDNWALMEKSYSYQTNEIIYCVEGIPYTFTLPSEDARFDSDLKELARCPFVVKLKTGDVTIAANREALVSDEKTLAKVHEILTEINTHFRNHVMESIAKCEKLTEMFELRTMYNRLRLDHMVRSFEWNGITINGNYLSIPQEIGCVHRIDVTKRGNEVGVGYGIKTKNTGPDIDFGDRTMNNYHRIYVVQVEEGKTFSKNQLLNALLGDDTILHCQLIVLKVSPNDPILNKYGFQYFNWIDLSGYPTKNMWRAKRFGATSAKVEYYEFAGAYSNAKDCWNREFGEVADLDEGVYFPILRGKYEVDDSRTFFTHFREFCKLPIYGMPVRSMKEAEKNPNLISHSLYLTAYAMKLVAFLNEHRELANQVITSDTSTFRKNLCDISSFAQYLPEDHIINRWKAISQPVKDELYENVRKALIRYDYLKNLVTIEESFVPVDEVKKMSELVYETYPMLWVFEDGHNRSIPQDVVNKAILAYVESVDREIANAEFN